MDNLLEPFQCRHVGQQPGEGSPARGIRKWFSTKPLGNIDQGDCQESILIQHSGFANCIIVKRWLNNAKPHPGHEKGYDRCLPVICFRRRTSRNRLQIKDGSTAGTPLKCFAKDCGDEGFPHVCVGSKDLKCQQISPKHDTTFIGKVDFETHQEDLFVLSQTTQALRHPPLLPRDWKFDDVL